MSTPALVTMTLYKFSGLADKYWAFAGMGRSHAGIRNAPGLSFYKLMGSGAGEGFSVKPNFSTYAFMGCWESEEDAHLFFSRNVQIAEYQNRSISYLHVNLKPIKSHGCWGGVEPFGHQLIEDLDSEPIAVLTRARIRMQRLPDFWRYVPPAAVAVSGARGRLFSVGVGEWPLIEQATFSIWDSMHSVREYAYKGKEHAKVVKYTRERNWYSEELFARFAVLAIDGDWQDERLRSLIQHSD